MFFSRGSQDSVSGEFKPINQDVRVPGEGEIFAYELSSRLEREEGLSLPKTQQVGKINGVFFYISDKFIGVESGSDNFVITDKQEFIAELNKIISQIKDEGLKGQIKEIFINDQSIVSEANLERVSKQLFEFKSDNTEDDLCKFIVDKLVKKFLYGMIKMDFMDGKSTVSIDKDKALTVSDVKKLPEALGVKSTAADIYVRRRTVDYTKASVAALSEVFITKEIAAAILGSERVQKTELIRRKNKIMKKDKLEDTVDTCAIFIEKNRKFKDFRHEFKDSQRIIDQAEFELDDESSEGEEKEDLLVKETKFDGKVSHAKETFGLGETFVLQAVFGNYDAFGSNGGNGGYDENGYFMIDLGKALEKDENKILKNVNSLLLVKQGKGQKGKNFSMFDNTSLVSRVKGLLLLHRAMGYNVDLEVVKSYGYDFYQQYLAVQPVSNKFDKYEEYFKNEIEKLLTVEEKNHWQAHIEQLKIIKKLFDSNANEIIEIGKKYFNIPREAVEIIDGLSKVAADPKEGLSCRSVKGEVLLNHIRHTHYTDENLPVCVISENEKDKNIFNIVIYINGTVDDGFLKRTFNSGNGGDARRESATSRISAVLGDFGVVINEDNKIKGKKNINFTIKKTDLEKISGLLNDENIVKVFKENSTSISIGVNADQSLSPHKIAEQTKVSLAERVKYLVQEQVIDNRYLELLNKITDSNNKAALEEFTGFIELAEKKFFNYKINGSDKSVKLTHEASFYGEEIVKQKLEVTNKLQSVINLIGENEEKQVELNEIGGKIKDKLEEIKKMDLIQLDLVGSTYFGDVTKEINDLVKGKYNDFKSKIDAKKSDMKKYDITIYDEFFSSTEENLDLDSMIEQIKNYPEFMQKADLEIAKAKVEEKAKKITQVTVLSNEKVVGYCWKTNNSYKEYSFVNFENSKEEKVDVNQDHLKKALRKVEEFNAKDPNDNFNILYVCKNNNKTRYFFTKDDLANKVKKPGNVCIELKLNNDKSSFDEPVDLNAKQMELMPIFSDYNEKQVGCLEKVFLSGRKLKEDLLEKLKNSICYVGGSREVNNKITFNAVHADPEDLFAAWVKLCEKNPLPDLLTRRSSFGFFESGDTESIKVVKQVFATLYGKSGADFIDEEIRKSLGISKPVNQNQQTTKRAAA